MPDQDLIADRLQINSFLARVAERLQKPTPDSPGTLAGDHHLNAGTFHSDMIDTAKPAAVLIPLVIRGDEAHVLLTQRSAELRSHSGQIAFPGGRIDAGETPQAAALRETFEEIGLASQHIAPLAQLPPYLSGTGYLIHPVLARITPDLTLALNPREVTETFEVPLEFLMDPAHHEHHSREWNGKTRYFYAMPYQDRYIWGVTAGILRALYERLYL